MVQHATLILLFAFFFPSAIVHADQSGSRDILVEVVDVSINESVGASVKEGEPSYTAITYQIKNLSKTKKPTLNLERKMRLIDEFGNEYRKISLPKEKQIPHRLPRNFPSLYPNDTYTTTVFYEVPIPAAKRLKFTCHADDLGLSKPVDLFIDITDHSTLMPIQIRNKDHSKFSVKIIDPPSGTIMRQGEVIHIRVSAEGDKPPKKIIVIALNTYFEDKSPAFENIYDLNIPLDQAPGSYVINVIAEWPSVDKEENLNLSDTLSFDIQELLPLTSL